MRPALAIVGNSRPTVNWVSPGLMSTGQDYADRMSCHNSAGAKRDKWPTLVVAITTSGTPKVMD